LADLSLGPPAGRELIAADLEHRSKYLLLAYDFLSGLLALHLDWVERVEAELDPPKACVG
jgi:hypothetical protein